MAYYKDLREHVKALEDRGKLIRIKREINKDTELMPLVRCQFRGLPAEDRKTFLFENVTDAKGRKYGIPVLVASHAANRDVYAIGMNCRPDEIMERWARARRSPIEPRVAAAGPVHEEVHLGEKLLEHGGLEEFPVPISTPGFDNAPYYTAANWISKDPESGIRNVGNYRGMIKSPTRVGVMNPPSKGLRTHWEKCRLMGKPLQAAIVIGTVPAVGYCAAVRFPLDVDELAISGGIAGEAIELVKCRTVDLEVPATAEIVIEGHLPTDFLEREGPFGEFTGYMAPEVVGPYFHVTCITHRKNPVFNVFLSQFPPSESSTLRNIGEEANLYKFLRVDCGLPVVDVAVPEQTSAQPFCVISMKKTHPSQAWQVLNGAVTASSVRKIVIVVDDDIDPHNADSVNWALSWRVQPARDVRIMNGIFAELDPSLAHPAESRDPYPNGIGGSAMLINATTKWDYPPVSLPRKEFMERAMQIWEEEGLPKLSMVKPWYGYSMGFWTKEFEDEAELALKGEHYKTGEKLAKQRVKP
jgi:4-hydroxy-3-polyprenylbenzoate decarboxylase